MIIKELSREQLEKVYRDSFSRDFAKDEIKPLKTILKLHGANNYKAFGAFGPENGALLGYAFVLITDGGSALLDYFAVTPEFRNQGVGSEFLQELTKNLHSYKILAFEVERVLSAKTAKEKTVRENRVSFYLKNNAEKTGVEITVYGVDYSIMYFPTDSAVNDEQIKALMREFYHLMIGNKYYDKFVRI